MTVGIVMTVCNIKTAHRGIIVTMPTVITLSPTLCDISILHASASRCGGPNGVASSASASWSFARQSSGGRRARSSHGALHGALGQYFDVPNHSRSKPNQEGGSSRPS
jgi:hypothetical protein